MIAKPKGRRSSPLYLPSAFELFKPSRDLVMKHIWVFGPLYIIPTLFLINSWLGNVGTLHGRHLWYWWFQNKGPSLNLPTVPTYDWGFFLGIIGLWGVFWLIASLIVRIMSQGAQLEAAEGKTPALDKLWGTVKELGWRMVGLYAVTAVIVFVGFILLVVPGLFMLRRYLLAPYVMLDKKCSIREALDHSAALSLKNTGAVWGLLSVMFLIFLVNFIPIIGGLAAITLGFLYSVAPALRYEQLKRLT